MNKIFKNKLVLATAAILIALIIVIIGALIFTSKSNNANSEASAMPTQIPIPSISADSIGLALKNGEPGKTIIASISKIEGITTVEYELDYTAKNPAPNSTDTDRIPRGFIGEFDLTKKPVQKEMKLGTCSDFCHYDQDIKDLKIVLKITKSDGKTYQSQTTLASVSQ